MAVFRIERTRDYTVMSKGHFSKREVMPYAKRKEKSPVYGRPAAR